MRNPSSISYINIHCHTDRLESSTFSLPSLFVNELNMDVEFDQYVSIGLHPWHIKDKNSVNDLSMLGVLAENENVLAIGECGLDRNISVRIDKQKDVFLKQIEIANSVNKPMIIHNVKAFSDFMQILKEGINKTKWIFHAYNANRIITKKLLNYDVFFSFGEAITNDFSKTREVIKDIPIDRLFFETDESDISIKDVYNSASELLNIDINVLKNQIYQNYLKMFIDNE